MLHGGVRIVFHYLESIPGIYVCLPVHGTLRAQMFYCMFEVTLLLYISILSTDSCVGGVSKLSHAAILVG